jgi:hypothetical protein
MRHFGSARSALPGIQAHHYLKFPNPGIMDSGARNAVKPAQTA